MKNKHRQLCIVGTIAICVVYLAYRLMFTLNLDTPAAATFSIMLYVAELYGNILMFLYFFQIWDLETPKPVPPIKNATVDVMIPTYNEELELLRGTIEAALAMDYAHTVHVLDDGNRPELRELCEELGANYFKRDSNIHAKAGNLNHALEQTTGEFVVIFDADHIAERHFITRTIGYFSDDKLGFVQTPHAFYNFDSFQGTLNYEKKLYWEEGHLFYNVVQPGKNNWNAVSFCGSAAIFRREALEDVGLIAVESITEDLQTGIRIHANGWKSIYVNERLVSGLAAPDIETFTKQRLRWGEGNLGTIFYDNPITKPGLNFAQRLNYLASMLNWTTGVQKLLMYVTPILMLLTGIGPVAEISWLLVSITAVYLLCVWFTVKNTGNGYVRLIDTEITQMATFWTQCRGTWRAIFNRRNSKFVVTRKSGSVSNSLHRYLRPHYTLIAASALAIGWAAARYFMGAAEDISGMLICGGLVLVNCGFAWVVIRRALAQRRMHWRHPVAAHVDYSFENTDGAIVDGQGITKDLSEAGASLVCYQPIDGYDVYITITAGDKQVDIAAQIRNRTEITNQSLKRGGKVTAYRYGLLFEELNSAQKRNLWHICTKYAVARHYHNFDPNTDGSLIKEVTRENDLEACLPVQLTLSNSDSHSNSNLVSPESLVTETVNNEGFVVLSSEQLTEEEMKANSFASIESMFGPIEGKVTLTEEAPVALGQMDLFARRYQFESFEGECRGCLANLLNQADDPHVVQTTSVLPSGTRTSSAWPNSIVAGISALAASVAVIGACFVYPDDALITKAILREEVNEQGMRRLGELSKIYEANPMVNEAQCLRLRRAFKNIGDTESLSRINEALANSEVGTTSAKLQRGYALEQLGRADEAAAQFDELIEEIDELSTEASKYQLLIASARNAANRGIHERATDLFAIVWETGKHNKEIRAEFAGLLAKQGRDALAAKILGSGSLSVSDRFLMASLQRKLEKPELARKVLDSISSPEHQFRVQLEKGRLELWSKNYDRAAEIFEALLLEDATRTEVQVLLVQSLSWGKRHRAALTRGYEFENQQQEMMPDAVLAMLESIAEVDALTTQDHQWLVATFERVDQASGWEEPRWNDSAVRFAHAIERIDEPGLAAQRLARLLGFFPESHDLQWSYTNVLYAMGTAAEQERYEEALQLQQDLLLKEPGNQEARYHYATNLYRLKKYELAGREFDQLVRMVLGRQVQMTFASSQGKTATPREVNDQQVDWLLGAVENMIALQQYEKATETMRSALDAYMHRRTGTHELHFRFARNLSQLNLDVDAQTFFDSLLEHNAFNDDKPLLAELLLAAASNSARLNNSDEMKSRYGKALLLWREIHESSPSDVSNWKGYLDATGSAPTLVNDDVQNIARIIEAFQSQPELAEDITLTSRLIDVMIRVERSDDALVIAVENFKRFGNDEGARFRLANNLQALSQFAEAETHFDFLIRENAFELDSQTRGQMMVAAARNSVLLGRFERSNEIYELLWSLGIKSRDHEVEQAVVLERLGFQSRANRIFNGQPLSLEQKHRIAAMYTRVKLHENAHRVYQSILDEFPGEEIARLEAVKSLIWMHNFDQAIPRLNELRKESPDDPAIFLMQAQAMFYSGNHDHALAQLRRRIKNEPENHNYWITWLKFIGQLPENRVVDAQMVMSLADRLIRQRGQSMSPTQLAKLLAKPLARSGKVDQAVELLESALKLNKMDPQINFELGEVQIIARRYQAAINHFEIAWNADELKEKVRYRLADALRRNGEFTKAIEMIGTGDPEDVVGLELLSSIYIDSKEFDVARKISEQLVRDYPESIRYQTRLANTYLWEGQYEIAAQRLGKLNVAHPEDREIRFRLGQALLWGGDNLEAKKIFLAMLEHDPNNSEVWGPYIEALAGERFVSMKDPMLVYIQQKFRQLSPDQAIRIAIQMSSIHLKQGQVDQAARQLEPWIDSGKDSLEFQIQWATVLSANSQQENARSVMQGVMQRIGNNDPLLTRARFTNADVLYHVGEYELALEAYRDIHVNIESLTERESESILRSLARVHVQLGDLEEAIRFFEQANAFTRNPSEHVSELAGVLAQAGYDDRALSMLTPLESLPHSAHYLKANIFAKQGRFRDASEIYRILISMDAANRKSWLGLGNVSAWGKDYKSAEFAYQQILQREPNNVDVQARLARVHSWNGKHEEAITLLVQLLESNADDRELLISLVQSAADGSGSNNPAVKAYLLKAYNQLDSSWHGDDAVTLAKAMIRNGLVDRALKTMEQIVKSHPSNQNYRRHLADELHQLGFFDRADFHYRVLLEVSERNSTVSIPVVLRTDRNDRGSSILASWDSEN